MACRVAKIHHSTYYDWLEKDPAFKDAVADAKEHAADLLVAEARRRAYEGVDEAVIHNGKLAGVWVNGKGQKVTESTPGAFLIPLTVKKYSDTLLIFIIKALRPEFRDRVSIDVNILHREAERLAEEYGLDPKELAGMADAFVRGRA